MIDPLLIGARKTIADLIDSESTILDVGCGTGELVFSLSQKSTMVVGIDKNIEMIKYARKKRKKLNIQNIEFVSKDANDENYFSGKYFDYAIFSMTLHQFSRKEANQILKLIKRVTKYIIMADYNYPLLHNSVGWGIKLIEQMAGREHYLNFKNYQKQGGLGYFLKYHQLPMMEKEIIGLGVIQVTKALSKTANIKRDK